MSEPILSQEEINALLASLAEDEAEEEVSTGSGHSAVSMLPTGIQRYDFLRPDKFSKDQLRTLQMMHDSFSRSLQTALAGLMRLPVQVEVLGVGEMMYQEFIDELSNPSVLNVVGLEPLGGSLIFEINPNLAFIMLDRLLGGPGLPVNKPRPLTDIEQTLMQRVTDRALRALEEAWRPVVEIRASLQRMEMNPQFVQIVPPTDMAVVISLRVRMKEDAGRLNLCIPYAVLEPVASKLKAQVWFASADKDDGGDSSSLIRQRLEGMRLTLTVELGAADVTMRDLLDLQVGDVIQLNTVQGAPLPIRIGSRKKFLGVPGRVGRRLAVQVLDAIREDD